METTKKPFNFYKERRNRSKKPKTKFPTATVLHTKCQQAAVFQLEMVVSQYNLLGDANKSSIH